MEHTPSNMTLAVLARFIRRYWRTPAKLAGLIAVVILLLLALPFLPRPEVRLEASSAPQPVENSASVESLLAQGVGAPFNGAVKELRVKPGQAVKKHQLLFVMDTSVLQPQLAAARAEVAEAQQGVNLTLAMRREELKPFAVAVATFKRELTVEQAAMAAPRNDFAPIPDAAPYQPAGYQPAGEGAGTRSAADPPATVPGDPVRVQDLLTQFAAAQARLSERQQAWAKPLAEARQRVTVANDEVRRIQSLIASATRRSPMDGVVTRVDVGPGHWANAGTAVVRVDNPRGYRVVTLVDQQVRDLVKLGDDLPMYVAGSTFPGKIEKIVPGEDKELGTYWLWLKPDQPEKLRPGQELVVSSRLPAR